MSFLGLLISYWILLCYRYLLTSPGGLFNNDEVLNHAIEFTGSAIQSLPIDDRLTIANMTTECECTLDSLFWADPLGSGTSYAYIRHRTYLGAFILS